MKPLLVDPANFMKDVFNQAWPVYRLEDLLEEFPIDPQDRHRGEYARDVGVSVQEVRDWNALLKDLAIGLDACRPLLLRTPTECCAFTTVLHELDMDFLDDFPDKFPGLVLPDCVSPLCAFADHDEAQEASDERDDWDEYDWVLSRLAPPPPPLRHGLRTWRVTVTLETEIDRTDHDCDPEVCPLEVTLRKRVTWKRIKARTRFRAEERALDRFQKSHMTREGSYGATSVCLSRPRGSTQPREKRDTIVSTSSAFKEGC